MSLLENLQRDVTERLKSSEYFGDIPVYLVRPRDQAEAVMIQTAIDEGLMGLRSQAGKSGAAIMVMMPTVDVPTQETPGPYLSAEVMVCVVESPLFNMNATTGTGKSAEEIGLSVLHTLHHWSPGYGAVLNAARKAMTADDAALEAGNVIYNVAVEIDFGLTQEQRAAAPVISGTSSVTLTSATPGAEIRYTVDGSFPGLSAAVYSAPFAVTGGATVRAAAYASGMAGSNVSIRKY